jgi:endonuclease VIII
MPEGPSIVILKEAVQEFKGKKVIAAGGNSKILDIERLTGQIILDFKSWGKHFLICFPEFAVRVHFMLFGSYRINEHKDTPARLSLHFEQGELNFYACSVRMIEAPLDELYDWTSDVMNANWNVNKALAKLQANPNMLVCDALLDQHIFAGVGNIIKNEVLFRIRVHPLSMVGKLPPAKIKELVAEAVNYSYEFLKWKKEYTLRKHWLAHTKTICPRDNVRFQKAHLGKTKRRSFFCTVCQELYI